MKTSMLSYSYKAVILSLFTISLIFPGRSAFANGIDREIVLRFNDNVPEHVIAAMLDDFNATELAISPLSKFRLWHLDSMILFNNEALFQTGSDLFNIEETGKKARSKLEVESAGHNVRTSLFPGGDAQETCPINLPEAGNCPVIVAVIDTGIDSAHYFHQGWHWFNTGETIDHYDTDNNGYIDDMIGYDFYYDTSLPADFHSHGTHVSGIIVNIAKHQAANSIKMMSLKAMSNGGRGNLFSILLAIDYAILNGANIINFSLGYSTTVPHHPTKPEPLEFAFDLAETYNILIVNSAGNNYADVDASSINYYPTEFPCPNMISVAAFDCDTYMAPSYSNSGHVSVDLSAPGLVYSTVPNDLWAYKDGTSMSAGVVSGIAAVLATHCEFNYAAVKNALLNTTDPYGLITRTQGLVNGEAALGYLLDNPLPRKTEGSLVANNDLLISPNPFSEHFYLEWEDREERTAEIIINNTLGATVFSAKTTSKIGANRYECLLPAEQSGIFLLTLKLDERRIVKKIIRF